jgi:hypothetical protein
MTAFYHEHDPWSFLPSSPQGRGHVSSVRWAHRGADSVCAIRAVRFPTGIIDVPRAHHVGHATAVRHGGRSRPVVLRPSW